MGQKKQLIITGGTGLFGATAALYMRDWEIGLWTRGYAATFPGIWSNAVKLEYLSEITRELKKSGAHYLIHAAGMTNVEDCETNQYKAYLSNVLTTKNLAIACREAGVKFVYISTDHVAADKEKATEDELGFPCNVYAKTKLEGEFEAIKNNPDALVIRTNFFAWGSRYRKSFLDFIVDNLRDKKEITLFDDVRFNALSCDLLLSYIDLLLSSGAVGTFNVTLDQCLTKYEFGILVAKEFNLDPRLIKRGQLQQRKDLIKRPHNLTLENAKLKTQISVTNTPGFQELLAGLRQREQNDKEILFQHITEAPGTRLINYGKQTIDDEDFEAVLTGLNSPWLTQGPTVEAFERAVADYTGSKYAVAMANWTCGLHMAVLAARVGPGDYVITSPLSFVASSNCAIYAGATPYFVDIDPETLNMDPIALEAACKKLAGKVKAIIPVHFAGAPCDMEKISIIARKYGAFLIEDAAHAIGGRYLTGEKIGNNRYSEIVGFSFHPVKNLTTGEGGLITTNSEHVYQHLLRLRSHGITKGGDAFRNNELAFTSGRKNSWYYEMQELGYNFRITDLQCALGISQMKKLETFLARKVAIVKAYDRAFAGLQHARIVQDRLRDLSGNHLYVIKVDFKKLGIERQSLFDKFKTLGINLHVHYIPIYKQPYYVDNFPVNQTDFIHTEEYYSGAVTLPVYPEMSPKQVDAVIKAVKEFIG